MSYLRVVLEFSAVAQHVQSGRLRVLAVLAAERSQVFPSAPTLAQERYPKVEASNYLLLLFSSLFFLSSLFPLPASFTSTFVAVIVYLIVTRETFLRSLLILVSLSRAISHLSLSFSTVITSLVTSRTGPVTWYSRGPAAIAIETPKSTATQPPSIRLVINPP